MLRLAGLGGVLFVLFFGQFASAQSGPPCNQLGSGSTPPAGYGASWNVLTSARELLVATTCTENTTSYTVGSGAANQYVYKVRYVYSQSNPQWVSTTLTGTFVEGSTDWLAGKGTLSSTGRIISSPLYWVGYICQWTGSVWKCGCRDAACATPFWQLQASSDPFGGGTTGGNTTGGSTGGGTTSGVGVPAATRTINVAGGSQLSSALSAALPGDHIVLADGTYGGITVSRSGQNGKPIVIRAQNTLGAKVGGDINLTGDYVWVFGMDVTNGGNGIIQGTGDRISSSRFRSQGRSISASDSSRRAIIDHNEIDSQSKGTEIGWYGIILNVPTSLEAQHHHVFRNYLYGAPPLTTGDDNTAIGCSGNGFRRMAMTGNIIEYNLVDNWKGDGETIMAKTGGCTFQFNTMTNSVEMDTRIGRGNKWIANWCEGSQGIRIHDRDNEVIGNKCNIRVFAGTWDSTADGYHAGYANSLNTLLVGNTGTLSLGHEWSGDDMPVPAKNTRVEAHNGNISRGKESGTVIVNTTSRTVPKAFKLTPAQVGPNAPTAPF